MQNDRPLEDGHFGYGKFILLFQSVRLPVSS